ncbi:asparagine synthase-related protein [Streptosporangium sp. NPDC006930]|uniref:asparagine synthase-related protein n=1 Tax=unclassified Streptosporangium TaxID=2632669 RepID=UPI003412BC98
MDFVILPDTIEGENFYNSFLAVQECKVITHSSGRPWVVGEWRPEELTTVVVGSRKAVILGVTSATAEQVGRALAKAAQLPDLDALVGGLAGSAHFLVSFDGDVRAQGTLSTTCQIFHARIAGAHVAADRPQTLAKLSGAGMAEDLLATRLLAPWAPWPLFEHPMWQGVEALPVGCYLELSRDDGFRTVRWWAPPPAETPLAEAAERVQRALWEAVAVRTVGGPVISADLSGGMDSTSLCFLANARSDRLITTQWEAENPASEDRMWAARAASSLPRAEHIILPVREAPKWFSGLAELDDDLEAPFAWIRTRDRLSYLAQRLAHEGSRRHLTGHGGDELFLTTPLYLHTLIRSRPLRAIRYLRANRAMHRWSLSGAVTALMRNRSFGSWLAESGASVVDPLREISSKPDFGWGFSFRMPEWATGHAVDVTRRVLGQVGGAQPAPLSPLRGQHLAVQDVRLCGDTLRRVNRLTSRFGVSWEAPYVDDRVLEAALSIRFEDCAMPDRYKPLLAASMRGIVPDDILNRSTKSEYSSEAYASLRANRSELLELCEDLELARLGLVDADALRSVLLCLPPRSMSLMPLISTFACETWLRSVRAGQPAPLIR